MAPVRSAAVLGVRIEADFPFPAGIYCFFFADWYFIKMLVVEFKSSYITTYFICPIFFLFLFPPFLHSVGFNICFQ